MKNIKFILIGYFLLHSVWSIGQDSSGWFNYKISATTDFVQNLDGGLNTGFAFMGMEQISMSFNTEKMKLWKGGAFFLHPMITHGTLPSKELTGDLQVFSNIEAGNYQRLYEYYYTHTFKNLSLTIGQHDLNSVFVGTNTGSAYVNSSFGILPSVSLNVPASIFPLAALAIITSYNVNDNYLLKFGIYDGNPGNPEENRYSLQPNIGLNEGAMFIAETETGIFSPYQIESVKIGAYYHTADFLSYEDTTTMQPGNFGAYFISDFLLTSNFSKKYRYLGGFVQASFAPNKINQVSYYVGGGLKLNGLLSESFADAAALALAYANTSHEVRKLVPDKAKGELALELTYKLNILNILTIQPNLQYIIHPGTSQDINNALVATLRLFIGVDKNTFTKVGN